MTKRTVPAIISLLVSFLIFSLAGCGGGNEDDIRGYTQNVTGSWEGTWESADGSGTFNFVMTQTDNNVEGINTRLGRFTGNVQANILYIDGTDLYGIVSGNDLAGTYTGTNGDVVSFQCTRRTTVEFVD